MSLDETKTLAEVAEGWLTEEEGVLLYHLAQNCSGRGVIVEIGSWKGRSTIWLSKGSYAGRQIKVYAIDPHTGASEHKAMFGEVWTFDEFKANIRRAGVKDIVVPIVKPSAEAAQDFYQPVEFIFIDGAHEYEWVNLDFEVWFPKVVEGGIMAFHDSTRSPGISQVVREKVFTSPYFRNAGLVHSITYGQKVKRNSLLDRLRNRYILLIKDLYERAAQLRLPRALRMIGKRLLQQIQ